MANSKLLKEAIADAKAVRETAIANAKIALEEAFTPRLQAVLSKKLQQEIEEADEEAEEIEENDYELTDPSTVHGIEDKVDTQLGNPQQPINDMSETSSAPVKSYAMEYGVTFECYGNEKDGFELRQGDRSMPSKFKNLDHADMAVKLFQKRRAMKQQAQQASQQDYLDER